ncbi:MAG: PaaI family thioesterase [Thermoanaerobacteraceae bacterium]|nr:PaaI family thioesterase [Thermoanaerobacteraceae bacterium]
MDGQENRIIIEDNLSAELVAEVLQVFNSSRFSRLMGCTLAGLGNGSCRITCPVSGNLLNSFNGVHGGVIATLADVSMGMAVATLGYRAVTVEMSVNYLALAGEGEMLIAEGRVIHQSKKLLLAECSISNAAGRLITRGRGLYLGQRD